MKKVFLVAFGIIITFCIIKANYLKLFGAENRINENSTMNVSQAVYEQVYNTVRYDFDDETDLMNFNFSAYYKGLHEEETGYSIEDGCLATWSAHIDAPTVVRLKEDINSEQIIWKSRRKWVQWYNGYSSLILTFDGENEDEWFQIRYSDGGSLYGSPEGSCYNSIGRKTLIRYPGAADNIVNAIVTDFDMPINDFLDEVIEFDGKTGNLTISIGDKKQAFTSENLKFKVKNVSIYAGGWWLPQKQAIDFIEYTTYEEKAPHNIAVSDLEYSFLTDEEEYCDGMDMNIGATLTNKEDVPISSIFALFKLDNQILGSKVIYDLQPGENRGITLTCPFDAGAKTLSIIPDNRFPEKDIKTVSVPFVEKLELKPVVQIEKEKNNFKVNVEVLNEGNTTLKDIEIQYLLDDKEIGTGIIKGGILKGETKINTYNFTADAGSHTLTFKLDPHNTIPEQNEGNNVYIEEIIAETIPDIQLVNLVKGQKISSPYKIEWDATSDLYSQKEIKISLSLIDGEEEIIIAQDIENNGFYDWNFSDISEGEYTLNIKVVDPKGYESQAKQNVHIINPTRIEIIPDMNQKYVLDGNEAKFELTIKNLQPIEDTFDLSIEDNSDIIAQLDKTSVTLGPWEESIVRLDISYETYGAYSLNVVAKSQNNASVIDKKTLDVVVVPDNLDIIVETDKDLYERREAVSITGKVCLDDGTPIKNTSVNLDVESKGFVRTFLVETDDNGEFSHKFMTMVREAGTYNIKASIYFTGVERKSESKTFEIEGLYLDPSPGSIEMSRNSSKQIELKLFNLGSKAISGLKLQSNCEGAGISCNATLDNTSIASGESILIPVVVNAQKDSAETSSIHINVTDGEGWIEETKILLKTHPAKPNPKLSTYLINTGINPGKKLEKIITLSNNGYAPWTNVEINSPKNNWISVSQISLGDINEEQSTKINLNFEPSNDLPPGRYEDEVVFSSDNHEKIRLNIVVLITPEQEGDAEFIVKDAFERIIPKAEVTMQHKELLNITKQLKTDEEGMVEFSKLPIGEYKYVITGQKGYTPMEGELLIEAEHVTSLEALMGTSLLDIEFEVEEITIVDTTVITVKSSTGAIIQPHPYRFYYRLAPGSKIQDQLSFENVGGCNISNVELKVDENNNILSLLDTQISDLKMGEATETIPITIQAPSDARIGSTIYSTITLSGLYKLQDSEQLADIEVDIPVTVKVVNDLGISPSQVFVKKNKDTNELNTNHSTLVVTNYKDTSVSLSQVIGPHGENLGGFSSLTLQPYKSAYINISHVTDYFSPEEVEVKSLGEVSFNGIWEDGTNEEYSIPVTGYIYGNCSSTYRGRGGGGGGGGSSSSITKPKTREKLVLEIPQELSLERQAFEARLKMSNGIIDFENIRVDLEFMDENSSNADNNFNTVIKSIEGLDAIDGTDTLEMGTAANVKWLIGALENAGGTKEIGKKYKVRAVINAKYKGDTIDSIYSEWKEITVKPEPKLKLTYYLPKDITANKPFNLILDIENIGYGIAQNVKIDSLTPKLTNYDNSYSQADRIKVVDVTGDQIGNISPGETRSIKWTLVSDVNGSFTVATAEFTHEDPYGLNLPSLIVDPVEVILVDDMEFRDAFCELIFVDSLYMTNKGYQPNPIKVKAVLNNVSDEVQSNINLSLRPPEGLNTIENQFLEATVAQLAPGEQKEIVWNIEMGEIQSVNEFPFSLVVNINETEEWVISKTLYVANGKRLSVQVSEYDYTDLGNNYSSFVSNVTLKNISEKDIKNFKIKLILPEEVELIEGNLDTSKDVLLVGEEIKLRFKVKIRNDYLDKEWQYDIVSEGDLYK